MVFFTQITMEAAEDPEFLAAMKRARIKGALVGVEAVTAEGLKDVYKDFNCSGEQLVDRLRAFRHHGVHVLGSFIFGLPSDRPETFDAHGGSRRALRRHLRAVRHADAVSRHGRLRRVGKDDGIGSDADRRHSAHAPLADPERQAAQGLRAASRDVGRRHPRAHAGGLGSVLQLAQHLGALRAASSRSSRGWRSC